MVLSQQVFKALLFLVALLAASLSTPTFAQPTSTPSVDYVPPELRASEPEVASLLESVEKTQAAGDYPQSFQQLQKAIKLCVDKGLLADKALIEARLGAASLVRGKIEEAKAQWRSALSDSVQTGNLVLQADILVSLASLAQVSGNLTEAVDLAGQALDLARRSKSRFIESRCLGEFSRLQLVSGKPQEARSLVEEALRIDRLNQYKWEAGHLLQLGLVNVGESKPSEAIQLINSARDLAVQEQDYLVFLTASESLGRAYVSRGDWAQAISLLEQSRDGISAAGQPLFKRPDSYRAAMSLPVTRMIFLEAIASAYQGGQRTDDALKTWQELYDVAQTAGFELETAGAAQAMADIYNTRKQPDKAIVYYERAAAAWAKGGSTQRQIDALVPEAFLLSQQKETEKALRLCEELLPLARSVDNRSREFLTDVAIAEMTLPKGDLGRTANALQQAETLLSPDLALNGVEPRFIFELYFLLAQLHEKKNEPIQLIVALEKAMIPAEATGHADGMAKLYLEIRQRLDAVAARDSAEKAYARGDLVIALTYFELIEFLELTHARWGDKAAEYNAALKSNPVVERLLSLPSQIIAQPGGASALEANLEEMGPILRSARMPILIALSRYYVTQGRQDLVVKFQTAAVRYANLDNPGPWDVAAVCQLAVSLVLQKDLASAMKRAEACVLAAKRFGDKDLLATAHQANVWVLEAAGKRDQAQESIQFLAQHAPEDPNQYVELAELKTQQGKPAEAFDAWWKALRLFKIHNELSKMAFVHHNLAILLAIAHRGDEDRGKHLESALALYKQLGDGEGQVQTSLLLGVYFGEMKDAAQAQEYFSAALKLSRQLKRSDLEASVQSSMGQAYLAAGEPAQALERFREAESIYKDAHNSSQEASELRNEASALDDLHQPEEAIQTALKAERIADISGSWLVRYWVRRLLGSLYVNRGEYESGLRALREARSISDSARDPMNSAGAASALAMELIDIGDWEEARDQANFALSIYREANDLDDEFNMYWQLTDIYGARESELKDFDKAEEYYRLAHQMLGKNDPREPGLGLTVEEIYWQQGRFKEAIAKASEAFAYYEQTKDELGQANALLSLAEAQRSSGDVQAAAVSLARAEPLVKVAQNFYVTGRFYYGLANQRKKEGRFKEAIAEYERVIDLLEQFKSASDPGIRRKASETYSFVYDELIDAYYSLGSHDPSASPLAADKALQYAELNKARAFTDSWGRTFIDALKRQVPAHLQSREREISSREETLQSELAQSMSGQGQRSANRVRDDLRALAKERSTLEKDLRQVNPAYAEARYPQPIVISDLPLHSGETLIEFKVLRDGLMVWVIQAIGSVPRLAAFYKVERSRDWFSERILSIRSAFNRAQPDMFDPQASEELFDAIFPAPFARFLTDAKSIVFIPDDILCLLPFEILSPKARQKQFVLLPTPTSYFPSAAALRLSRKAMATGREWQTQFFGIADPITSADDERYAAASVVANLAPVRLAAQSEAQAAVRGTWSEDKLKTRGYFFDRLPETATEVRTIASLFPAGPSTAVVRTGMEATKHDLFQTDLIRFRFIHFATHGFLPVGGSAGEPALVLSYGGKDENQMMLTLTEVLGMKLHAEMVVLSACNTGTGRVTRAEGVASLGMAFLAAGASSATVSLWKVSDKSTAILMQEFYRNLLNGMPKNAALAAARSALAAKGYANPFFWAPFVLTGE